MINQFLLSCAECVDILPAIGVDRFSRLRADNRDRAQCWKRI